MTLALAALEGTIVATAVPQIVGDLGGFSLFGWVFSAYLLTQTVTIPIYGKLADVHGRKPVLLAGIAVFLVGSALCASAWCMAGLIAFRAIQGVGAGAIHATVQTVAGDLYPLAERGRIQARLASVWGVSAVIGPLVGGLFASGLSWRWIFLLNLPVGAVAAALLWRHLRERVERVRRPLDVAGTVLLLTASGALILGLLQGGVAWAWSSPQSIGVFAVALLAAAATVVVERRAVAPVMPPWVWSRERFGANLGMACLGLLVIGPTTFLPLFGQTVMGLGSVAAGFLLAVMIVSWPLAASYANRAYLRIGFRDSALCGAAIATLATVSFVLLPERPSAAAVIAVSLVLGVGCGLLSVPLIVGVQSTVGWEGRGVVTSTAMFSRFMGQTIGAGIFGAIANGTLHRRLVDAPPELRGQLPDDLDGISRSLEGGARIVPDAAAYLGRAMSAAVSHVYVGLAVAAATALVLLWTLMPRRLTVVGDRPGGPVTTAD
ncbi:MFS transporter [Patulibacter defluvii]|uniref:MFS transporter n=1 Tax=Patulibacter defluvii TaxID=3095358 RepID=UPI002A759215|nr:MFS transporter [Patulibacter sp. DM4]